ncbi:MAG TPA: pyridoxamine 5'-phosphate oxidase family protein [Candidatus Bathyarchaeia archaeon]|nr:pyridoxamine 5'-phosphate oxidase family protein [Candidatus Bathyarchaeia archaeon]
MTEILTTSTFAYLCTASLDNQPHITPMFFVFDEKTYNLYVITSTESKKMKNIHVNPKVSLTIDTRDAANPFYNRGLMVQGKADVHSALDSSSASDDRTPTITYATFERKYPVLQKVQLPVVDERKKFSGSLISITPSRMVYWKGPNFMTVRFDNQE